jgi:hypothetical protein
VTCDKSNNPLVEKGLNKRIYSQQAKNLPRFVDHEVLEASALGEVCSHFHDQPVLRALELGCLSVWLS